MVRPLDSHVNTDHVSSESLAAYLSRRLSPAELVAVEAHLAECAACREELIGARRVLARRSRPGRVGGVLGAAALAATVLLMLRSSGTTDRGAAGPDEFRGGPDSPAFSVTAPTDGAVIADSGIVFRWSSAGADRLYRISVLTEAGDRLWSGQTTDTTLAFPIDRKLQSGATYLWYVDAIGAAGDSATSGPVAFGVR